MTYQTEVIMQEMKLSITQEVLKCNLWDYNGAYIVVRGNITVIAGAATQVTFKN